MPEKMVQWAFAQWHRDCIPLEFTLQFAFSNTMKNEIWDVYLQEMIDEADRDGDGEVNLEEFERIMRVRSCLCNLSQACHQGISSPSIRLFW